LPAELQREVEARTLSTIMRQNSSIGQELSRNVFSTNDVARTSSLEVRIGPEAAVANGARWRVGGGEWQWSGEEKQMAAGTYVVEYSDVNGFITPPDEEVNINGNAKIQMTVTYLAIAPPGGCNAGTIDTGPPFPKADVLLLTLMGGVLLCFSGIFQQRTAKRPRRF
jgi:hypothetical protein